jgi:hypothetical protein
LRAIETVPEPGQGDLEPNPTADAAAFEVGELEVNPLIDARAAGFDGCLERTAIAARRGREICRLGAPFARNLATRADRCGRVTRRVAYTSYGWMVADLASRS